MTDHRAECKLNEIQTAGFTPQNIVNNLDINSSSIPISETTPLKHTTCVNNNNNISPVTKDTVTTETVATTTVAKEVVRKQLPAIPDSETEAEMTATLNSKQTNNAIMTGGSGFGQLHLEYILMAEFNSLHKQKLPGVYVIPSALSPLIWNGVIFIRQGLYQEAVFKFNLNIPENYPNGDTPRVFFEHPVFHPLVDQKTGELDVKREFRKWRRNVNFLWQVLMYVRRVFFKIDTKSPLNTEAAELYESNIEQFKQKIVETITSSKQLMYNPVECNDPHMIRFSPWEPNVHEEAKSDMLTRKKNRSDLEPEPHKKNGLSWMKPDSTQIFTQENTHTTHS